MGASDEVSGLMGKGLEFSMHCGFQSFHVLVARFLDVRFPRWRRSEVRFPGCLVRFHQRRRSCQLHRVLQRDLKSSEKNHDEHRFIGSLDVLAVGLELRVIPVEVVSVHLESSELLGESVFDVGWHEPVLEYLDERRQARWYLLEMSVCRDAHGMSGKPYCHGVNDFLGMSDLVHLV